VLTTNGTSLEPGFYLFLGFVLAGLVLSTLLDGLDRRAPVRQADSDASARTGP
jgi:hypothetical protein